MPPTCIGILPTKEFAKKEDGPFVCYYHQFNQHDCGYSRFVFQFHIPINDFITLIPSSDEFCQDLIYD
jgi:hypothetical protein